MLQTCNGCFKIRILGSGIKIGWKGIFFGLEEARGHFFANADRYCVRIRLGPALLISSEYDDKYIKIYLITMLVHVDWYLLVYK